jgi:hypothetical protein
MPPFTSVRRHVLLLTAGLLLATGCVQPEPIACAPRFCKRGACEIRNEAPVCVCSGQLCSEQSEWDRMRVEAVSLTPSPADSSALASATIQGTDEAQPVAYFSFEALARNKYFLGCVPSDLAGCRMRIFAPSGELFMEAQGEPRMQLWMRFRIQDGGRYYVAVTGLTALATGHFDYALRDFGPDDHGDSVSSASVLTREQGLRFFGELEMSGDRDVYAVTPTAGRPFEVLCQMLDELPLDKHLWQLELLDAQGALLAETGVQEGGWPRLQLTATKAQRVHAFAISSNSNSSVTGGYMCTAMADDHANTAAQATPLAPPPLQVQGYLAHPWDLDDFLVTVPAGRTYTFTCDPLSRMAWPVYGWPLSLLAPDGTLIEEGQRFLDAPTQLTLPATDDRSYVVQVGHDWSSSLEGTYSCRLEDVPPAAGAQSLATGG